ncbi:MAG: hypothetical protein D3909_01520 [Candidatus Electrothrix sp. ATG1]|nr:hypothetical protein [Candidatus Electrothrix sp. ATG1]
MKVYMKVPGNSLELPDKFSFFVVSPPEGGEMGVNMKVPAALWSHRYNFHVFKIEVLQKNRKQLDGTAPFQYQKKQTVKPYIPANHNPTTTSLTTRWYILLN